MNRIPVARLTRGDAVIVVCYDDYWDDISTDPIPPHVPLPPPEYSVAGDRFLKREFEDFADDYGKHGYQPYSWSRARTLAWEFSKEFNGVYEDIFPQELIDEVKREYDPNKIY